MKCTFTQKRNFTLAIFLIVMGVTLRVLRHYGVIELPPNVAPVSALAMFGAVYLPRQWNFIIPGSLMLISDVFIGFYSLPVMLVVYGSFGLSCLIGQWQRQHPSLGRIFSGCLLGSIIFFLLTNSAVWGFGNAYPKTLAGLYQALVAGLPYFRNTVIGDLAYTGLFFGAYQVLMVYWQRSRTTTESLHA